MSLKSGHLRVNENKTVKTGRKTMSISRIESADALASTHHSVAYAWYVTFILTACYTLSFMDSKIPFILVQFIKKDLALTDTEMGILAGPAFSLTYALCTMPLAKLSDRLTRKYIIAGAVTIWSAFTASCGVAHSFGSFMFGRVGVAFGESALTPAAHSMIADYFPERQRAKVIAIYFSGIAIGSFLALAAGGFLADRYGWRSAMYAVGATGIVLALLMLSTVREPVREQKDPARNRSEGSIFALFANPAIRNTIIGGTILGIAGGVAQRLDSCLHHANLRHVGLRDGGDLRRADRGGRAHGDAVGRFSGELAFRQGYPLRPPPAVDRFPDGGALYGRRALR